MEKETDCSDGLAANLALIRLAWKCVLIPACSVLISSRGLQPKHSCYF